MSRLWDQEEIDWAVACATAGDTVEEIAEAAGRTADDVARQLAHLKPLTEAQRQVAACWAAGMTSSEIDRLHGVANGTAYSHLRRIANKGYPVSPRRHHVKLRGPEIDALVARLGAVSRQDLGRRLGLTKHQVCNLSRRGLPTRAVQEALHG